jgi:hypothetical protein
MYKVVWFHWSGYASNITSETFYELVNDKAGQIQGVLGINRI